MKNDNNKTLVLFNEIGSATEPNEGSSLAIDIPEEFYQMRVILVASTYYGKIKKFATEHPHFKNAGMMFDKEILEPMYKLTIGKSEDSNALFISKKMGIKDKVLQRVKIQIDEKNYKEKNYKFEIINEAKLVKKLKKKHNF